jgi:pyruvate dehydrogenase kinase 2/3/4
MVSTLSDHLDAPEDQPVDHLKFCDTLRNILHRQTTVYQLLMDGFHELGPLDTERHQSILDRFYTLTMGSRLLVKEHLSMHDAGKSLITSISPSNVALKALADVKTVAEKHYQSPLPNIDILTTTPGLKTVYIHDHLHQMLYQMLKHSIQSTMTLASPHKPDIKLIIAEGQEDVTFKLSDESGGIPQRLMKKLWQWGPVMKSLDQPIPVNGIPHSRIMARYFGGDLEVMSMEGYGTDMYLHLFRQETAMEQIPESTLLNTALMSQKSSAIVPTFPNEPNEDEWLTLLGV